MKIIGHRGAAGLAPENTTASINTAIATGVDGLGFDLRLTKDQHIVICHDPSLKRTYGVNLKIADHSLSELRSAAPNLPTFGEIIRACGQTPMVIELKEVIPGGILNDELKKVPKGQYSIVSFKLEALTEIRHVFPGVSMSLLSFAWPCWREHQASSNALSGIGVYWLFLNPIIYWQTKRHGLEIYTYTVSSPFLAKWINRLYPRVNICTNRPDKLQFLRTQ